MIHALVESVSKNGNMLLNVGPDARGEIPAEELSILDQMGNWMKKNCKSIYECGMSEMSKPEWGRFTQNGKKLYAHIYERGIGPVCVRGLNGKVKKARLLSDGSEIKFHTHPYPGWESGSSNDIYLLLQSYSRLPDEIDTVVELELF